MRDKLIEQHLPDYDEQYMLRVWGMRRYRDFPEREPRKGSGVDKWCDGVSKIIVDALVKEAERVLAAKKEAERAAQAKIAAEAKQKADEEALRKTRRAAALSITEYTIELWRHKKICADVPRSKTFEAARQALLDEVKSPDDLAIVAEAAALVDNTIAP